MADDYYQILGVGKSATPDEINKAYRSQARKLHPDLNPDDPKAKEKFQRLQEAFEVLNNPEKRKVFDQFGISPDKMGQGPSGAGGFQWNGARSPFGAFYSSGGRGGPVPDNMDLDDILGMFGMGVGARARSQPQPIPTPGAHLERTIRVPFTMSILGGNLDVKIGTPQGRNETIGVKVPAGIEDGKKIRLRGQGNPGTFGGKPGDLLLTVRVEPHPSFRREGGDLYVSVPVTLNEAVFGAKIELPSPKGTVSLVVPPNSSSGTKLRLKGFGVPVRSNGRKTVESGSGAPGGDLYAELLVVLPKRWSEEDKRLVAQLRSETESPVRGELQW